MATTSVVRVRGASSAPFREFHLDIFRKILPRKVFRKVARRTLPKGRRNRTLVPEVVVWLMGIAALNVFSMNAALEQGRHLLRRRFPRSCASVTAQAWEKARRRLPLAYFRMLFEHLATRIFKTFDPVIRWKGFRVLAGDGSCLSLPESSGVRKAFGGPSNQRSGKGPIQARLTCLVSVFTGACLAFALGPYTTSEIHLLLQMISHLGLQDLVILDRGFFGCGLLWKIRQAGAHFLVRAQGTIRPRKIRRLGPNDWLCEFRVSWDARRKWPGVPRTLVFRMIRTQIRGHRPVVLLTSLTNPVLFQADELTDLYFRRWRIETVYRELKHAMNIQNLRSQSEEGVQKEVCVHLLFYNLVRWVMQEAAAKHLGKDIPATRLSFEKTHKIVKADAARLILATPAVQRRLYDLLLETIAAYTVLQRPGRSFPRSSKRVRYAARRRRKHHGSGRHAR